MTGEGVRLGLITINHPERVTQLKRVLPETPRRGLTAAERDADRQAQNAPVRREGDGRLHTGRIIAQGNLRFSRIATLLEEFRGSVSSVVYTVIEEDGSRKSKVEIRFRDSRAPNNDPPQGDGQMDLDELIAALHRQEEFRSLTQVRRNPSRDGGPDWLNFVFRTGQEDDFPLLIERDTEETEPYLYVKRDKSGQEWHPSKRAQRERATQIWSQRK